MATSRDNHLEEPDDDAGLDSDGADSGGCDDSGGDPSVGGVSFAFMGDDVYADLSAKQQNAILHLLQHATIDQAAKAANVGQRTLYRWLTQRTFVTAYRRARRDSFTQAISLTQRYAPLAVNTLASVMMDQNAAAQSRVSAAAQILRFCREALSLDDLAQRIEALEEHARDALESRGRKVA